LAGEFLYVSNSDGTISEFSINTTTGALTNVGTFKTIANALAMNAKVLLLQHLAIHPTNEFIYVADDGDNDVLGFDIGDGINSGLIFAQNSQASANEPFGIAISPNGGFLYAADSGASIVSEYSIDQKTGQLTSIGTVASGTNPIAVTVESTGRYAYVANFNSPNISEYVIQPNGTLTANGTLDLPLPVGTNLANIATALPGASTACLYATANGAQVLYEMAVDSATGTLTYLGNVPVNGTGFGIAVHPNEKFVYTANALTGSISVFTESAVSPISGVPPCTLALTSQLLLSSSIPRSIAVEPTGKFAYVADFFSFKVDEFSIDSTTGALTQIGEIANEPSNPESAPIYAITTH